MKEEPVFWLGGKPAAKQATNEPPAATQLEPAILEACRARGAEPEDFVVALGGYGSWLVHFDRGQGRERVVWNGRDNRLVLQSAIRTGGWRDLRDCAVPSPDQAGFVAGIASLLAPSADGAA